ncbi:MAG: adenosylcobinamide-GDP ribazoletransferase [bacterium]
MAIPQTEKENLPQDGFTVCWMRFVLALTFLTRIPIPIKGKVTPEDMRASMGWYPLIGLGMGAVGYYLWLWGNIIFPPLLSAAMVIVLLEMFTGALHLDGFMDTCDGIGSGAPRERALEIMKDSRVGAMGAFGAVALILLKVAALAAMTPQQAFIPFVFGWMAARIVPVINVALFAYARPTGTGGAFTEGKSYGMLIWSIITMLIAGFLYHPYTTFPFMLAIIAITLIVQSGIAKKLGGLTGDVYGMGIELTELLALIAGCVLVKLML